MPRTALRQLRAASRAASKLPATTAAGRTFASHVDLPAGPSYSSPPARETDTAKGRLGELQLLPAGDGVTPPPPADGALPPSLEAVYAAYSQLPPRPAPLTSQHPSWLPPSAYRSDPLLPRTKHRWTQGRNPVFLPNVTLTMVRPPRHELHNPYLAFFHCDLRLTKIDIFNYLRQIYGLQGITSIRTAIYRGPYRTASSRSAMGFWVRKKRLASRTFKKVFVGLSQPFFYPPPRSASWLNEEYAFADSVNRKDWQSSIEENAGRGYGKQKGFSAPSGNKERGYRPDILGAVMAARAKRRDALAAEGYARASGDVEGAKKALEGKFERERKARAMRRTDGGRGRDGKLLELEGKEWFPKFFPKGS